MWGGLLPFLPPEFRMTDFAALFYLALTLSSTAGYLLSSKRVYRMAPAPGRGQIRWAVVPYLLGWSLVISAAYLHGFALPLAASGGVLLGLGTVAFYLLWQRLFASREQSRGDRDLLVGTALSAVFFFALQILPPTVTTFLIPLVFLPLFALALLIETRTIDWEQAMFEDVPSEHGRVWRRVVRGMWRSVFCVSVLGFCAGIMRSLAVFESDVGSVLNVLSMAALFMAAGVLYASWSHDGFTFSLVNVYRWCFPFIITAFLALPFAGTGFAMWMAGMLHALYSVASVIMTIHCAQLSRENGINPVFLYGLFGSVVTIMHDAGFLAGGLSESLMLANVQPLMLMSLVSCYALALIYFIGQGAFRNMPEGMVRLDSLEFVLPKPVKQQARRTAPTNRALAATDGPDDSRAVSRDAPQPARETLQAPDHGPGDEAAPRFRDRVSKQTDALRKHYGLSTREAEVLELMARGNSVPNIAEKLVVSENTIRTHSKRIYKKLDVHKKQDLLDLIDEFGPEGLAG